MGSALGPRCLLSAVGTSTEGTFDHFSWSELCLAWRGPAGRPWAAVRLWGQRTLLLEGMKGAWGSAWVPSALPAHPFLVAMKEGVTLLSGEDQPLPAASYGPNGLMAPVRCVHTDLGFTWVCWANPKAWPSLWPYARDR